MFMHDLDRPRRVQQADAEETLELVQGLLQGAGQTLVAAGAGNGAMELRVALEELVDAGRVLLGSLLPASSVPTSRSPSCRGDLVAMSTLTMRLAPLR